MHSVQMKTTYQSVGISGNTRLIVLYSYIRLTSRLAIRLSISWALTSIFLFLSHLDRFIPTPCRSRPCRPHQLWWRRWQARCHCRHCWPQPCPYWRTYNWCQASSTCFPSLDFDSLGCQGLAPCCWCHHCQEVPRKERDHRCLEQDRMGSEARQPYTEKELERLWSFQAFEVQEPGA